jgi:hypothetical protein
MQSSRHRVRRDYAPLNIAVSVAVSGTPLAQVYNAEEEQYEPDRTLTSTVLSPRVFVSATDGSIGKWVDTGNGTGYYTAVNVSATLADVQWQILIGSKFTTLDKNTPTLKYLDGSFAVSGRNLIVTSNIRSGAPVSITCVATYADSRQRVSHVIISDPVILTTTDKAEDLYAASLDDSSTIVYDPFVDRLSLLEYERAKNYIPSTGYTKKRLEIRKRNDTYERNITVMLYKGKTAVSPEDYVIVVMRAEDVKTVPPGLAETVPDSTFTVEAGTSRTDVEGYTISFDARLISKQTYVVVCMSTDKTEEYARTHFAVRRRYPRITIDTMNETSIQASDTERSDRAVVRANGQIVSYPERLLNINWFADTKSAKATKLTNKLSDAKDGKITYDIAETQLTDSEDDYLEVYVEAEYKPMSDIAVAAVDEE